MIKFSTCHERSFLFDHSRRGGVYALLVDLIALRFAWNEIFANDWLNEKTINQSALSKHYFKAVNK